MKTIILAVLATIFISTGANANGYYNPYDGLFYGNICYANYGRCILPVYHPVGFGCFCTDGYIIDRGIVGQ